MKTFIFVQARMGSTRLPGKVLGTLAGKPQLQHLLDRLGEFRKNGSVTVVTSDNKLDDAIEEYCRVRNVNVFRGSEHDVLDRFYQAALNCGAGAEDVIVRITADCPLHHEQVVRFALTQFEESKCEYFSNSFSPDYEDGCDTEVFFFKALEIAHHEAKLASQREHVTPYIKDSGKFKCCYNKYDQEYRFKLSVDTPADHGVAERIFNAFAPRTDFDVHEVVQLIIARPELIEGNKESIINAGYLKSLKEDKEI